MSKKSTKNKKYTYTLLPVLPLVLILAIVPLIVFLKVVPANDASLLFTDGKENFDFFSYYKMVWLVGLSVIGVLIYLYKSFLMQDIPLRKSKLYYPLGTYAVLVILSTFFASYKSVAMIGFVDRYEGMLALLSYIAIMFLAYNTVDNEKHVKWILTGFSISGIIMILIGITQFFGTDIFTTDFGKKLILPAQYENLADSLNFIFAGSKSVYATLYNINYVGVYMSMLFSLMTTLFILTKDLKWKIFFGIMTTSSFLMLLGSKSRAGLIAIFVFAFLSLIFFRKQVLPNWKTFTAIVILIGVSFVGVNTLYEGSVITRLKGGIESLKVKTEPNFQNILLEDETATVEFTDYSMTIVMAESGLMLFDTNEEPLDLAVDAENNNIIRAVEPPYNEHSFITKSYKGDVVLETTLKTNLGNRTIRFIRKDDIMMVLGYDGELVTDIKAPSFGFKGRESMASNRGYIWSRSIPMLKDNVILGHGPDTYALYFPNNDFVGKFVGFNSINTVVDKPHNLYLQIGINTGVLSLLAFLTLIGMYMISSFKAYFKKESYKGIMEATGLGIFMAVCMYLFTGLSNDSIVSVAPIFWILLGTGFVLNEKVNQE
ncbi:MAG: O-antigen ligase family protein [Gudongella sp.]|nr:O-antigen ligase family protein [Gudongella sp.]